MSMQKQRLEKSAQTSYMMCRFLIALFFSLHFSAIHTAGLCSTKYQLYVLFRLDLKIYLLSFRELFLYDERVEAAPRPVLSEWILRSICSVIEHSSYAMSVQK